MNDKYLPIGSIVLLNNGTKKLMITGFCVAANNDQSKIFDYSGCLYPEGMLSSNEVALFNHEQIKQIYAIGFSDEEEKNFKIKLKQEMVSRGY